jgi:hypothetical protein
MTDVVRFLAAWFALSIPVALIAAQAMDSLGDHEDALEIPTPIRRPGQAAATGQVHASSR